LDPRFPKGAQGRNVGHYTLLEQIGSGGMGEVYSAVRSDGQFDQKVAIKLVRTSSDSSLLLSRFRNERQILAGLDHVNIARLLDGGTTDDGIPFFAMELVSGSPIDTYCDAHKLSVSKRLELFRQVCSAVQYAHQHLVIHRDIKPGNILVTDDGVPKLLDFGIARILDDSGTLEATQFRSFTPEYASPEQLRGDAVSTATDLYSLGVVLYQLLTGRFPYRLGTRTVAKLASAIATGDPERPSTSVAQKETVNTAEGSREVTPEFFAAARETTPSVLQNNLRGDLDFILLKALRKEPEQRYSSAEQLSEDIHNHLEGRPVSARKGTWAYHTTKFLRSHRAGVAAAAIVFVALLAGVGVTLREARIAEANRRKADARFNDVRKLANSLLFEVHDSIQDLPGATEPRKLIMQKALLYLDSLAEDSQNDVGLMREIAGGYVKIAEVEGNPLQPNLGDTKAALESYQKSLALRESIMRLSPNNERDQLNLAETYIGLSELHMSATGNMAEAYRLCLKSIPILEKEASSNPKSARILGQTTRAYVSLGMLQIGNGLTGTVGTIDGGVNALEKALVYDRRAIELEPKQIQYRAEEASVNVTLGDAELKRGNLGKAEEYFRSGLKTLEALDTKSNNIRIAGNRAVITTKVGDALMIQGRYAEARDFYQKGFDLVEKLRIRDPRNEPILDHAITAEAQLALSLTALGNYSECNRHFRSALSVAEGAPQQVTVIRAVEAIVRIWYGQALEHEKNWAEASRQYEKSAAILEGLRKITGVDPRTQSYHASARLKLAGALGEQGKFEHARNEYQEAASTLEKLVSSATSNRELLFALAETYNGEGIMYERKAKAARNSAERIADWKLADGQFQRSLATWKKVVNPARYSTIGLEVSLPSEVESRLAECDAQIKSLETPQH